MIEINENPINSYEDNTSEINNSVLSKTFFWMFLGLLATAIVSWYTYSSDLAIKLVLSNSFGFLILAEFIIVLVFTFLFKKLSPTAVGILFFIYAALTGATVSVIFLIYELNSIILLFVMSAVMYGSLAFYGYKTSKDLSSWSTIITVSLLTILATSIINLIFNNPMMDILIDSICLLLFFGITVYDINKMKQLALCDTVDKNKLHIYCAMELYLDFINIFLRVLRLMAKRKN